MVVVPLVHLDDNDEYIFVELVVDNVAQLVVFLVALLDVAVEVHCADLL